jgi:hypothetical protein
MELRMVALYSSARTVKNGYLCLKAAIAGYALAVARDTQTNGHTV